MAQKPSPTPEQLKGQKAARRLAAILERRAKGH